MANLDELQVITNQLADASARLGKCIDDAALFGEAESRLGEEWETFSEDLQVALELLSETLVEIPVDRSRPGVHALDKLLEEIAGLAVRLRADPTGVGLREITARLVPVDGAVATLVRDLNNKLESTQANSEIESLKQQLARVDATEASLNAAQDAVYAVFDDFDRLGGHPAVWSDMENILDDIDRLADEHAGKVASGE